MRYRDLSSDGSVADVFPGELNHAHDLLDLPAVLFAADRGDFVGLWCDAARRHESYLQARLAHSTLDHRIHGDCVCRNAGDGLVGIGRCEF